MFGPDCLSISCRLWSILVTFFYYRFGCFVLDNVWFPRTRSNKLGGFDSQYTLWSLTDTFDKFFTISRDDKSICKEIIKNTICNIL